MRFVSEERELHKAFVRVPVKTVTTVFSPDMADVVELSGFDEYGEVLPPAAFYYGIDFDETRPAEYVVIDRIGNNPDEPWVVINPVPGQEQEQDSSSDQGDVAGDDGEVAEDDSGYGDDEAPGDDDPGDDTPTDDELDGGDDETGNDSDTGSDDGNTEGDDDPGDGDSGDDEGETGDPDDPGDNGAGDEDDGSAAGSDEGEDEDTSNSDVVVIGDPEEVPSQRAVPVDSGRVIIEYEPDTPVIPAGMLLTNVRYGGDVEVQLDPPTDWRPSGRDPFMQVEVPYDLIPNAAWPRSFDLIVQYQTARGLQSVIAPRPYWIPQLADVLEATTHNMPCGMRTPLGRNLFAGIELLWYGGGTAEHRPATSLEFWLSRDGNVPNNLHGDAEHRLLFVAVGSPNLLQLSRIDAETVLKGDVWVSPAVGMLLNREGGPENASGPVPLIEGDYRIVIVGDYGEFGRLISVPDLAPITICPPASYND
jgi:hypothetical protein